MYLLNENVFRRLHDIILCHYTYNNIIINETIAIHNKLYYVKCVGMVTLVSEHFY